MRHTVSTLAVCALAVGSNACGGNAVRTADEAPAASEAAAAAAGPATPATSNVTPPNVTTGPTTPPSESTGGNPLLYAWAGPHGGVPAFDEMRLADLEPALDLGMTQNLAEVDVIANNPQPATFENTVVALERAGRPLGRAFVYWGI